MAGNGPIQYNELFASDVEKGLSELEALAERLDSTFASLSKTILNSKTRISISIKEQNGELRQAKDVLGGMDVAAHGAADALSRMNKVVDEGIKRNRDFKDSQAGINNVFNLATASVDEIKSQIKALTTEYNSLKRGTDNYSTSMKALDTEVKSLNKELTGLTATFGKNAKIIEVAENTYQAAAKELSELKKMLQTMPGAMNMVTGEWNKSIPAVEKMVKRVELLDGVLKKADASMGVHGRSVGNYASAFNPLGHSIAQISRELPTLAINFQMFALAISNNLPLAADAIGDLVAQNKALQAEGKPTVSVFKQLIGAIFSWQSLLSIGISLFVVYGKQIGEFVSRLFKSKEQLNSMRENANALNEVIKEGNKYAGSQIASLKVLAGVVQDVNNTQATRLAAAKELQKEFPKTFGNLTTEAILNNNLKTAIDATTDAIIKSSRARAAQSKLDEIESKRLDIASEKERILKERAVKRSQVTGDFLQTSGSSAGGVLGGGGAVTSRVITVKEQKDIIDKRADLATKEQDLNDKILENQAKFLTKYIGADRLTEEITGGGKGATASGSGAGKENTKNALEKLQDRIDGINTSLKLQALLAIEAGKAFEPDQKTLDLLDELIEKLRFANALGRGEDISGKAKFAGVSSTASLNPNAEIGFQAKQKESDQQVRATRQEIEKMFATLKDSSQVIGEIFGSEFGGLFEQLTKDVIEFADQGKISLEDFATTAIAGIGSIDEAFKVGSQNRISALELEKQAQVDIAGTNAVARLNIEKQYNDRIRAEKRKQAQIDKAAAMFEISINTAVAASKTLGETGLFGIPLLPLVIGLGLAQLAAVAARPIPQFRHGTQSAPGGLAEVAEDGPEAIISPRGHLRIAHKRQIAYVEKGSRILTTPETQRAIEMGQIGRTTELHERLSRNLQEGRRQEQINSMTAAFTAARMDEKLFGREVGAEIAKLPFQSTTWDERGIIKHIQKGNTNTKILNERYSLK